MTYKITGNEWEKLSDSQALHLHLRDSESRICFQITSFIAFVYFISIYDLFVGVLAGMVFVFLNKLILDYVLRRNLFRYFNVKLEPNKK